MLAHCNSTMQEQHKEISVSSGGKRKLLLNYVIFLFFSHVLHTLLNNLKYLCPQLIPSVMILLRFNFSSFFFLYAVDNSISLVTSTEP
jgi:hypothetical protein